MRPGDGSKTICAVLRGIKTKIKAHMSDRGKEIKNKTINDIDLAIDMAKRMQNKLEFYKEQKK